jgi:hypothetical protein
MPLTTYIGEEGGKVRAPSLVGDYCLAIEGERSRPQPQSGSSDRRIALGPVVTAAGKEAHGLAVVFDLVHPARSHRRRGGPGRDAGIDKAIGTDTAVEHARLR